MLFWLKKFISFWLMPLPFCLTAMIVGLVLLLATKRTRLGRTLVLTGLGLLMIFSNNYVSKWLIRPLESRYPAMPEFSADVPVPPALAACRYVVVLGGGNGYSTGVSANNLLSSSSLSRVIEAVRILHAVPDAKMIVSGPGDGRSDSHAVVLARTARAFGIAADRIITIEQADDTEEEARHTQRIAQGARVALVTSAWHMPRSMALFRSIGLDPLACPTDFHTHAENKFYFAHLLWNAESLSRTTYAIRERIGYLWIWLRGKG